jgi:hypothetical protein
MVKKCNLLRILAIALLALAAPAWCASDARALNGLIDGVFSADVHDGYVEYPKISRNVRFHKYIEALADADLSTLTDESEKIAFWLNVYNAMAVKSIIDGIRPFGTLGRLKFFRTTDCRVAGRNLDLNSVGEILGDFGDARVRFAMVDAAYSSPNLLSGAYRGEQLDEQLNAAAREFINDNRKNRYSDAIRSAQLSQIFERHQEEFGADDQEVMAFVAQFVEKDLVAKALTDGRYEIKYLDFDWSINGRPM